MRSENKNLFKNLRVGNWHPPFSKNHLAGAISRLLLGGKLFGGNISKISFGGKISKTFRREQFQKKKVRTFWQEHFGRKFVFFHF
jgi:hypothetical protein